MPDPALSPTAWVAVSVHADTAFDMADHFWLVWICCFSRCRCFFDTSVDSNVGALDPAVIMGGKIHVGPDTISGIAVRLATGCNLPEDCPVDRCLLPALKIVGCEHNVRHGILQHPPQPARSLAIMSWQDPKGLSHQL